MCHMMKKNGHLKMPFFSLQALTPPFWHPKQHMMKHQFQTFWNKPIINQFMSTLITILCISTSIVGDFCHNEKRHFGNPLFCCLFLSSCCYHKIHQWWQKWRKLKALCLFHMLASFCLQKIENMCLNQANDLGMCWHHVKWKQLLKRHAHHVCMWHFSLKFSKISMFDNYSLHIYT